MSGTGEDREANHSPPFLFFMNSGNQFDAIDVETIFFRIERAGNLHLFAFEFPGTVLVIKLVGGAIRDFQNVPVAVLYDHAGQGLCSRLLLGRLLRRLRGLLSPPHCLSEWLGFLHLRPGD